MLEATLFYFRKDLTGETIKERARELRIYGKTLEFGSLRIDLSDPTLSQFTLQEVPNTPEEAKGIKSIEDALEVCRSWALSDEELEELMK